MSQFAKHLSISLNPNNPASLCSALVEYRQHLADGTAFRYHGGLCFNIEFANDQGQPLTLADAGENQALLQQALQLCRQENRDIYTSEAILFAASLNYPELSQELELTAQAIVDYARSRNDSGDMFIDDMNIFGLEPLLMLVLTNPEKAHYLASFLIPYWNSESFSEGPELLNFLVGKFGWQRALIKAYIHCDSFIMRRFFYCERDGDQLQADLLSHLQQHQDDYQWFKNELVERLIARPMLNYPNEHLTDKQVIQDFFYSLGHWQVTADYYDNEAQWKDQVLQLCLFDKTIETEVIELLEQINIQQPSAKLATQASAWNNYDLWNNYGLWNSNELGDLNSEDATNDDEWDENALELDDRVDLLAYVLESDNELLKQKALSEADQTIPEPIETWLDKLPTDLGCCAYVSYRLNNKQGDAEENQLLFNWLQQHLAEAFYQIIEENSSVAYSDENSPERTEFTRITQWLAGTDSQGDSAQFATSLAAMLNKPRGKRNQPNISVKQPAYELFKYDDGLQRGLLCLFWLLTNKQLSQQSELAIIAQRHWQLLNQLAPQRVINRIFYFYGDYHFYAAIDDVTVEQQLEEQLLSLGVEASQLQAFQLLCDQQVAGYRPADKRFWQRYLDHIEYFAKADANDNSMLGTKQWNDHQQLLDALQYSNELPMLQFISDTHTCYPESQLPIDELFELSLARSLSTQFDNTPQLIEKLQRYLCNGERVDELSVELQGWNIKSRYQFCPADFIWLLPEAQAIHLARLFAQLDNQKLSWLDIPSVEKAYINHLIQRGEITMSDRWSDPKVGHNRISDPATGMALLSAKDNWAQDWLAERSISVTLT